MVVYAAAPPPPAPEHDCGAVCGSGPYKWARCTNPKGHDGDHQAWTWRGPDLWDLIESWPQSTAIVVHLRSQAGQPYGSERRCCNLCGVMLVGPSPLWVEHEAELAKLEPPYVRCDGRLPAERRGT